MAVQLQGGAIFLHIPKTGGSWVTEVFQDQNLAKKKVGHKHADFAHAMHEIELKDTVAHWFQLFPHRVVKKLGGPKYDPALRRLAYPFTFCFVRHPLRWYESYWKFTQSWGWCDWGSDDDRYKWHPNAVLNGLGSDDFNVFMRRVVEKRPGYVTEMFGAYAQPQVNFVGRQEHLVEDLITALRAVGERFDEDRLRNLRPVNVTQQVEKKPIVWDEGLKAEVKRLDYAAFVRYGYDCDAP